MLNFLRTKFSANTQPDPYDEYRIQSADLRVQLHQSYDREKLQKYTIAQLQAENHRLAQENTSLRLSQQQAVVEELADRLLDRKSHNETPSVTIPCSQHQQAHFSFQTTG